MMQEIREISTGLEISSTDAELCGIPRTTLFKLLTYASMNFRPRPLAKRVFRQP